MNVLLAAVTLEDVNRLLVYNIHHLEGKPHGKRLFSMYLGKVSGWRMVVMLLDEEGNQTDLGQNVTHHDIKAVQIMEVCKHYGD